MNKLNRKRKTGAAFAVTAAFSVLGFAFMAPPANAAVTADAPPVVIGSNPASSFDVKNLAPITDICKDSKLEPHTGFQIAPACVSTEFGEVASQDKDPSLLIVKSPEVVKSGADFTIKFSSKNLIRDRFLKAGDGGYYAEGAVLDPGTGLTHGHAHIACRVLASTKVAPDQALVPAFFLAIEDNKGSAVADTVTVKVPGKNAAGGATFPKNSNVECTVWAGDGSHRVPMMQRANQTPAIDSVRIKVVDGGMRGNKNDGRGNNNNE
jgi:hypothetical protein